jgi:predicted DCC family thiol-disulfide oxidoreductase YuxK
MMRGLTVLYDHGCELCRRCRAFLEKQETFLVLEFVAGGSAESRQRFPTLRQSDPPEELIVIDDEGGVYRGADAWIVCLYALRRYRGWSERLARGSLRPLARAVFEWVSHNRKAFAAFAHVPDAVLAERVSAYTKGACTPGNPECALPRRTS